MIKKIAIIIILILSITSTVNAHYIGEYYGDALFSTNKGPIWIRNVNGSTGAAITSRISNIIPATTADGAVVKSAAEVTVKSAAGTMAKAGLLSTIAKMGGRGLFAGIAMGGLMCAGEAVVDYLIAQGRPEDELHLDPQGSGLIMSYQPGGTVQP